MAIKSRLIGETRCNDFIFSFEDTGELCYKDIASYLSVDLGWKRIQYRKKSKASGKINRKDTPIFCWTLNEKDLDFPSLVPSQIVNHYFGVTHTLTTKLGFCDLLREMNWVNEDSSYISPRCFNLGDPVQREEFVEEFRLIASTTILKWSLLSDVSGLKNTTPENVLNNAIGVCVRFLKVKVSGEWPHVDEASNIKISGESSIYGLSDTSWEAILSTSYSLSEMSFGWDTSFLSPDSQFYLTQIKRSTNSRRIKIWAVLRALMRSCKQFSLDGTKNIWIVKVIR